MLERKQPFKLMLLILGFYGFWKPHTLGSRHKVIASIAFVLFLPLLTMLSLLSFMQINNIGDYALSFAFSFIFVSALSLSVAFVLKNKKIQDLFDDFTTTFNESPDSWASIDRKCLQLVAASKGKYTIVLVWLSSVVVGTYFTGAIGNGVWQPESLKGTFDFFFIAWMYFSVNFVYTAFISLLLQDFFNDMLSVLLAYVEYFLSELRQVDLQGESGRVNLIRCIRMHQSIRRLMAKFVAIVKYALGFRITFGSYLLCTMAFAITTANVQLPYLVTLTIMSTVQELIPCRIAQDIESASENFIFAMTETNWFEADLKTKKLVLTCLTNLSTPPVKFQLFGFIDINLKSFTKTINVAYSTYAVLNNMR